MTAIRKTNNRALTEESMGENEREKESRKGRRGKQESRTTKTTKAEKKKLFIEAGSSWEGDGNASRQAGMRRTLSLIITVCQTVYL